MSDFKIVCGTNPEDKQIVNLHRIRAISLVKKCDGLEHNEVWMDGYRFETDLTTLEQVHHCIDCTPIEFSIDRLNQSIAFYEELHCEQLKEATIKTLGLEKVGDRYVPTKEDELCD